MRAITVLFVLGFSFQALAFPNPFAPKPKEWTFLVFINGHNNLDRFGAMDINEMEQVGSSKDVNIVVQWASQENKTTKRLYVTKDNDTAKVTSKTVADLPRVDMGSYLNLVDFIKWGAKKYPAKHYVVVVWNHGAGWHIQNMGAKAGGGQFHIEDISYDDNTGNKITTYEQGLAMDMAAKAIGQKIDIVGNDACLMAMPEVALQMRNSVNYFVGSEETEPGEGWPYAEILAPLVKKPKMTAAEFSTILVEEYLKSYSGGSQGTASVTQSVFDLSESNSYGLIAALRELGQTLYMLSNTDKEKVRAALANTLVFAYNDYADLIDFLDKIEESKIESAHLKKSIAYTRAATASFVLANATSDSFKRAHGLSVWIPSSTYTFEEYMKNYSDLDFNKMTGWATALQSLYVQE